MPKNGGMHAGELEHMRADVAQLDVMLCSPSDVLQDVYKLNSIGPAALKLSSVVMLSLLDV